MWCWLFNTPYYELGLWCFCDPDFHLYGYTGLSSYVVSPAEAIFDTSESLLLMYDPLGGDLLGGDLLGGDLLGYVPPILY